MASSPRYQSHNHAIHNLETVHMSSLHFLDSLTSIASTLQGLIPPKRNDLYLSILIAEPNATTRPTWTSTWTRRLVDDLHTYNISSQELTHLQNLTQTGNYPDKGVYDYTYALNRGHETGAPCIALFEDDIMLANGWFVRTLLGLNQIARSKDAIGGNCEHWIILAVRVVISALAVMARTRVKAARSWLDTWTLCLIVLVLNPVLVILFFQSGKASLLPPASEVFEEAFGCCSQARIFPRGVVPEIVGFLGSRCTGQVDLLLDEMAGGEGVGEVCFVSGAGAAYGLESARETVEAEAQAIWSMAFEYLDALVWEREHLRMVGRCYSRPDV
ncbi:hypothetical protein BBP40_000260 [Aspergillus hancockii]|nr:hypothetical protein BBP40_000260 [Aspergillus hancockii]